MTDQELEQILREELPRKKYQRRLNNGRQSTGRSILVDNIDNVRYGLVSVNRECNTILQEVVLNEASYKCWHWRKDESNSLDVVDSIVDNIDTKSDPSIKWSKGYKSKKEAKQAALEVLGPNVRFTTIQGASIERMWIR